MGFINTLYTDNLFLEYEKHYKHRDPHFVNDFTEHFNMIQQAEVMNTYDPATIEFSSVDSA